MGQKGPGVCPPRLFKDRPTDGNAAACAAPFYISAFAIAWATPNNRSYISQLATAWFCALCCCGNGHPPSVRHADLNPRNPARTATAYIFAAHAAPSEGWFLSYQRQTLGHQTLVSFAAINGIGSHAQHITHPPFPRRFSPPMQPVRRTVSQ